jgi:glucosamine--fructose-6-phosphate aminotransferase (isomerizing)
VNSFLSELEQMPAALTSLIDFYREDGYDRLFAWRSLTEGKTEIIFSGMGTSNFSPMTIIPRLNAQELSCRFVDAGEWLHYGGVEPLNRRGLLVVISQSGESVELKELLTARKMKPGFVAITNDPDSTLARGAARVFPLCAGEEHTITTKTYSNTLALLHLLAGVLTGRKGFETAIEELDACVRCLREVDEARIEEAAKTLMPGDSIACIGRGPSYVSAQQCALTFGEGAKCLAAAYTGGAFNHGPFECAGPEMGMIIFQPAGRTSVLMQRLASRAQSVGAKVVVLADESEAMQAGVNTIPIRQINSTSSEQLFPLLASRSHNLLLYYVAKMRGIEAGRFRYGNKITSEE